MKTALVFLVTASFTFQTWVQGGSITFLAFSDSFEGDISPTLPRFNFNCTMPFGVDFMAQGYVGLSFDSLSPVGPQFPLFWAVDKEGNQGGFVNSPNVALEENGLHLSQIKVWEAATGDSYEEAVATGGKHGKSNIFLIDAVSPPGPSGIPEGLETICIVPEPSSGMLIFGGALFWGLWRWKVRKR